MVSGALQVVSRGSGAIEGFRERFRDFLGRFRPFKGDSGTFKGVSGVFVGFSRGFMGTSGGFRNVSGFLKSALARFRSDPRSRVFHRVSGSFISSLGGFKGFQDPYGFRSISCGFRCPSDGSGMFKCILRVFWGVPCVF